MSKEKRIACEVIRNGLVAKGVELEVGQKIELTEAQMKGFIGKVKSIKELKEDEKSDSVSPKGIAKLVKQVKSLEEKNEELTKELAELKASKKGK